MAKKKAEPKPYAKADQIPTRPNRIFSRVRQKWLVQTPEELVRQTFLDVILTEYGFTLDQIAEEEELTGRRGTGHARTDFVIWRTVQDKKDQKPPLIVVECKSDNVTIKPADYAQGDNYARITNAPFFVTHNTRETRFWRVRKDRMPGYIEEIETIPHADASDKEIDDILKALKTFKEDEFADLLHKCHNVIRNREKKDPVAAFDEIAKVLFIKVHVERDLRKKRLRQNRFTEDYLKQLPGDQPLDLLFQDTKRAYAPDGIFDPGEALNLKPATGLEIVKLLQSYDLSDTSEDIKGIAFERFLGRTFRGEIGQFFTPRCIVEFMVRMVDPKEGDVVCDPASGSGGFLIRFFEVVREQVLADADRQYQTYKAELEGKKGLSEAKRAELLRARFDTIQRELDQHTKGSRLWKLANQCIYGTDANDRMARTSKMNMIMHGDGHGGIHYHDGLVDINGVFAGRFSLVLTNPPFGQNVGDDQKFGGTEETRVPTERAYLERCRGRYGDLWETTHRQTQKRAADKDAILEAYEIGEGKPNRPTELLFLERCIQLLQPGGRMGIVLPDGNLNNPSLAWLRRWAEGKARLLAVVSLPEETFVSADATVKASLVFLRKFTAAEAAAWEDAWQKAHAKHDAMFNAERTRLCTEYGPRIAAGETPALAAIMREAEAVGLSRQLPEWKQSEPPKYPRGVGLTTVGKPRWTGEPSDKKRVRELRKQFEDAWTDEAGQKAEALTRELRIALRKVDRCHNVVLWREVREIFDYPVFTAAPDAVGITSTGADGPNQLPDVLAAYRRFTAWLDAGARPSDVPRFDDPRGSTP